MEDARKRQKITPSLTVCGAEKAIEFYGKVFGAQLEGEAMRGPGGAIMHAELKLGEMRLFVNDEFPEMGALSPEHLKGSPVSLQLMVDDVDRSYATAIAAGAISRMEPHNAFWGDRYAFVTDPFGHGWGLVGVHELLTPEEIRRRSEQFCAGEK